MFAPLEKLESAAQGMERRPRLCLGALAVLLAIQIGPWFYYSPDGCAYLSLARNIASGEEPAVLGQPRLGIPLGYPLLISPAFWFSERPFLLVSAVNWLLAMVLMLGVYRWLRRQIPEHAVLLTSLIMVNAGLWYHFRRPLKEIAFLAVMVWLTNALQSLLQGEGRRRIIRRGLLGVALLILLLTVRYSGIVLIAGFGVALLLIVSRNAAHRRLIVGTSVVIGLCSLAALGVLIQFGGDLYLKAFVPASGVLPQVAEGLRLRISEIGRLSLPGMFKSYSGRNEWLHLNMGLYLAILPMIAWGWWQLAWRRRDVLAMTLPFYFVLYVAWPFDQGARFMLPMVPALVTCLWLGARPLFPRAAGWTIVLLLMHLGGALGYWIQVDAPRAIARHHDWAELEQLAAEIGADEAALAVRNFDPSLHAMLELSLDRRLPGPLTGPTAPAEIHWILQPKLTADCIGFQTYREAGNFHLLARTGGLATAAPPANRLQSVDRTAAAPGGSATVSALEGDLPRDTRVQ